MWVLDRNQYSCSEIISLWKLYFTVNRLAGQRKAGYKGFHNKIFSGWD